MLDLVDNDETNFKEWTRKFSKVNVFFFEKLIS
jgi:hypothetical protein